MHLIDYTQLDYLQHNYTPVVVINGQVKPVEFFKITISEIHKEIILFGIIPQGGIKVVGTWNRNGTPLMEGLPYHTHDKHYNLKLQVHEETTN